MLINSFFLKRKEQHKIKMLYEIKNNSFITIDDLKSLFSISEYKAKALINDIQKDINKSGYGEKFRFFSRAIFCIYREGIDVLIQEIVNTYYRESQYVRFIIEYTLLNNQVSVISEKVHISISKSYNIRRILQKITLENVSLSRENKEIFYRKLLFTIFSNSTDLLWEYSCKNVDDFLHEVLSALKDIFIVRITDKCMRSIKIILLIIYYRVKYGFKMNKGIFNSPSVGDCYETRIDDLLRLPISKKLKIGRDDFFFLYSNKLIPSPTNLITLFNKKYQFNIRVSDYILNQLLTSYFFDTSFIPSSLKKEEPVNLNFPYFFDEDRIKYSKIIRDGKIREID